MTLIPQFLSALQRLRHLVDEGPQSLMTRAALAATTTFPGVDGAVVCAVRGSRMRAPVGCSDPVSLLVEQLEYTLGVGPGLDAQRLGRQVVAGNDLADRWPVLHEALRSATHFRAVRAVPLPGDEPARPVGVMLLMYATTTAVVDTTDAHRLDIARVSLLIGHALTLSGPDLTAAAHPPASQDAVALNRRLVVDVAVRMVMASHDLPADDALDLIRGLAYAGGGTIDDTAQDLVAGRRTLPTLI